MDREKLREVSRRRPFQPFRVHLVDGKSYDVLFPNMHILGQIHMTIGIPDPNVPRPVCGRMVIVMLSDIARVESLPAAPASSAAVGS